MRVWTGFVAVVFAILFPGVLGQNSNVTVNLINALREFVSGKKLHFTLKYMVLYFAFSTFLEKQSKFRSNIIVQVFH